MAADRHDDFTRAQLGRRGKFGSGGAVEAENRDVRAGVPPDEFGRGASAAGEDDRNIFVAADGMFGGDDEAGFPQEAARTDAVTRFDRDSGLAGALDQIREVCRKIIEDVFHASMMIEATAAAHQANGQVGTRFLGWIPRRCFRRPGAPFATRRGSDAGGS